MGRPNGRCRLCSHWTQDVVSLVWSGGKLALLLTEDFCYFGGWIRHLTSLAQKRSFKYRLGYLVKNATALRDCTASKPRSFSSFAFPVLAAFLYSICFKSFVTSISRYLDYLSRSTTSSIVLDCNALQWLPMTTLRPSWYPSMMLLDGIIERAVSVMLLSLWETSSETSRDMYLASDLEPSFKSWDRSWSSRWTLGSKEVC